MSSSADQMTGGCSGVHGVQLGKPRGLLLLLVLLLLLLRKTTSWGERLYQWQQHCLPCA
jgi:hypothetical protein